MYKELECPDFLRIRTYTKGFNSLIFHSLLLLCVFFVSSLQTSFPSISVVVSSVLFMFFFSFFFC